jgi:hypothetical protein
MKKNNDITRRRPYCAPLVERIKLDKEIALALESEPPIIPGEGLSKAPEYFNNDAFKNNIG